MVRENLFGLRIRAIWFLDKDPVNLFVIFSEQFLQEVASESTNIVHSS
jgi:hypothetical protein